MKWSLTSDSNGVTHHSDVGKSLRFLRFTLLKCQSPASSDPDTMTVDPCQYLLSRTLEFCQWTTVAREHRAMINFSTFGRTTAISGGVTNAPKFQPESLPAFEPQLSTVIGQRQTFNLQDQQTIILSFSRWLHLEYPITWLKCQAPRRYTEADGKEYFNLLSIYRFFFPPCLVQLTELKVTPALHRYMSYKILPRGMRSYAFGWLN